MLSQANHIILAEDDEDDSLFFEEALNSIADPPHLILARDGEELTQLLQDTFPHPDLIFLDLNMPRKNGAQCLCEIRKSKDLRELPVVVLSTSSSKDIIDDMYQSGANLYIQKPNDVNLWKRAIAAVLKLDWNIHTRFSVREIFTLTEY
ncbi:MAG TPA: response regulator [Saprospiraceae bacterium]|nr:response regulator [Saprospiraceae bacterium]